uniref:hypothetical protein n=1 Tax=Pseudonocardia sp. CA-138482 TaxID=3240023 RepID=UPI003F49B005
MVRAHPPNQPLVIICEWCNGERIPTIRQHAWHDAVDHAIDHHLAKLLANRKSARRYLRIVDVTGQHVRLTRTTTS